MKSIATLVVVLALAGPPASDPWSRFRGPNGTGISATSDIPTEFGPTKNVLWKAPVPAGHSSPVLTPTHIFMTGVDGEKLVVFALDRAKGNELWRHDVARES